jgi:hypothetical protein
MTRTSLCRLTDGYVAHGDDFFTQGQSPSDVAHWRHIVERLGPQLYALAASLFSAQDLDTCETRLMGGIRGLALQVLASQRAAASEALDQDTAEWQWRVMKEQGHRPS